jgi:hypothetical protein
MSGLTSESKRLQSLSSRVGGDSVRYVDDGLRRLSDGDRCDDLICQSVDGNHAVVASRFDEGDDSGAATALMTLKSRPATTNDPTATDSACIYGVEQWEASEEQFSLISNLRFFTHNSGVNIRVAELQLPLFDERPVPAHGPIEKLMYLAFLGHPPSEAHGSMQNPDRLSHRTTV